MSGRGRQAALPAAGYRPPSRAHSEPGSLTVRFEAEDRGKGGKDYDFAALPVSSVLRAQFAGMFAAHTRASAGARALPTAENAYRRVVGFCRYLGGLQRPPTRAQELTPAHLEGWFLQRRSVATAPKELEVLKAMLKRLPGITPVLAATLSERGPYRYRRGRGVCYTRGQFDRILNAARGDVRGAVRRIRASRGLLDRWRAGLIDPRTDRAGWRRGRVLDVVDRIADVPRVTTAAGRVEAAGWVHALGTVEEHVTALHLSTREAVAFTVLLVGLTGQNRGTVVAAPAAHHRVDGYTDEHGTAIVELDKPRRGADRHMDVVLTGLPAWVPGHRPADAGSEEREPARREEGERMDLRSASGVYLLLHEVAAAARAILGSDRLLVWWASAPGGRGKENTGPGLRTGLRNEHVARWADGHGLRFASPPAAESSSDVDGDIEGGQVPDEHDGRTVTLARLRLSYLELHQMPVAHSESTLANEYLVRNRGDLAEYRRIVADTLDREVVRARTRGALRTIGPEELRLALTDPDAVAARHDLDAQTLRRMLNGQRDTVLAACADELSSPHTRHGTSCRASFMLCLACPNARALPHHLPAQVAVHDALLARRAGMTPLRWAQRLALPHAQLVDLLDRAGEPAVADARAAITAAQLELVARFLDRELDLS